MGMIKSEIMFFDCLEMLPPEGHINNPIPPADHPDYREWEPTIYLFINPENGLIYNGEYSRCDPESGMVFRSHFRDFEGVRHWAMMPNVKWHMQFHADLDPMPVVAYHEWLDNARKAKD